MILYQKINDISNVCNYIQHTTLSVRTGTDTGCPITHGIIKTRWSGHLTTTYLESCKVSHFEAKYHTFLTRDAYGELFRCHVLWDTLYTV
jgi:hypothetical protein